VPLESVVPLVYKDHKVCQEPRELVQRAQQDQWVLQELQVVPLELLVIQEHRAYKEPQELLELPESA
jgi:hypothetical protein